MCLYNIACFTLVKKIKLFSLRGFRQLLDKVLGRILLGV